MFRHITRPEILMIVIPGALFIIVLELVRRRRLREDYSLLWLGTFAVLVALSILRDSVLDYIADLLGIFYPPMALFIIGFGLLLVILLQFSMVITQLARENKQAAQAIAMLNRRIQELEQARYSAATALPSLLSGEGE